MAALEPVRRALGRDQELDSLVSELCRSETRNGRYVIQMPVVTGYGSMVSVSVYPEGSGQSYRVSDAGLAYHEVLAAAASERIFTSVAASKAKKYGASFDGGTLLFIRVVRDRLKGAVVAMASLIREVIDETIEKSFLAKNDNSRDVFIRRVADAFPGAKRTEHATVYGQSTTSYDVDLLVEFDHANLAFNYFSRSGNSVNSAYVTLSDIARLEAGPIPVGVTPSLKEVGSKLVLVASVARVIESEEPIETYRRLVA